MHSLVNYGLKPRIWCGQVALMFLVRGDIYHEDVWTAWIGDLADLVPPSLFCDEALAQCYRDMPQRQAVPKSVYDRQSYFSIVVHTKPNYPGYNEGSIFDKRIVQERVEVRCLGSCILPVCIYRDLLQKSSEFLCEILPGVDYIMFPSPPAGLCLHIAALQDVTGSPNYMSTGH